MVSTSTVGVITRTKDRPLMLPRAFDSVRAQGFPGMAWTIVNDGGDPVPVDAIAAEAVSAGLKVRVVHHERSLGMEAASNAGIAATPADYVVIHDDDDSWSPTFLRATVDALDTAPATCAGVVCHSVRVDEVIGEASVTVKSRRAYNPWLKAVYLSEMAEDNPFPPISFLFRRSAWEELGGFDESLPVLGDWDFNLRILARWDVEVLPMALANYHHRLPTNSGSYGNSIHAGSDRHALWDSRIRNKHLRQDLEAGRVGLGTLLADGRARAKLSKRFAFAGRISTAFESLASRTAAKFRRPTG